MNASEVADRIASRYDRERGWAVLREVVAPYHTSGQPTRRYDAVALSLWGSLGVQVHGFEIKTAKADWQAEMLNPAKSAPLAAPCDYWWVVAPRDVVDPKTAPAGWGVLHVAGKGLRIAVPAPKRVPVRTEAFWQCMLSRLAYRTDKDDADRLRTLTVQVRADHAKSAERSAHHEVRAYTRLKAQVEEFEKRSGVSIDGYVGSGARAADLLKAYDEGVPQRVVRAIAHAHGELERALATVENLKARVGGT